MNIIKYDDVERLRDIAKIIEISRQKYAPETPETKYEDIGVLMKTMWPNTVMQDDVLIVTNNEGQTIGFGGLFKSGKGDSWLVQMDVHPNYETIEFWNDLIESLLKLAKEQNAPELHFRMSPNRTILREALRKQKISPDHFIYTLKLANTEKLPEIAPPKGIEIKATSNIPDRNQYIAVMNEAYKNVEEWTPDTKESLNEFEEMQQKNFKVVHYLAYKGKKLVGACDVYDDPKTTTTRFINSIGVQKKFQHKGIGGALMSTALQDLREKGKDNVIFYLPGKDQSDIELPLKFGFKEIEDKTQSVYSIKIHQ